MTAGGSARQADNRRGALLLVLAAALFTGEVIVVRLLAETASNGQIVFARAAVQLLVVGALIAGHGGALLRTGRPGLHLLRGLTSLLCWWLYYRSFQALDLALATTLTFSTSLFVVALAAPFLGERPGALRWGMTLLGFGGVVLASGASGFAVEPGVLLGFGAAGSAAVLVILNRLLSRTEATLTIMFYIGLVATLGTAPGAALDWRPLTGESLGLLCLAAGLGTLGMFLTIEAYRVGEVSALAPFPYLRLVFAVIAGMALFAETPGPRTLAGGAIIVVTALILTRHERRRGLASPSR